LERIINEAQQIHDVLVKEHKIFGDFPDFPGILETVLHDHFENESTSELSR